MEKPQSPIQSNQLSSSVAYARRQTVSANVNFHIRQSWNNVATKRNANRRFPNRARERKTKNFSKTRFCLLISLNGEIWSLKCLVCIQFDLHFALLYAIIAVNCLSLLFFFRPFFFFRFFVFLCLRFCFLFSAVNQISDAAINFLSFSSHSISSFDRFVFGCLSGSIQRQTNAFFWRRLPSLGIACLTSMEFKWFYLCRRLSVYRKRLFVRFAWAFDVHPKSFVESQNISSIR